MPRILFVTGKLAEPALRRALADLAPAVGFEADVAVLPITVAALLTTDWVGRKLTIPEGTDRILLPGYCRGDLAAILAGVPVERGPKDLRDLPEFFGKRRGRPADYGAFDIEILAEINHAPTLAPAAILALASHYRASGADVIDVGCDPGGTWAGVGDAVRLLRDEGFRVSVDSFNPDEVEAALAAGADLVLSVNGTNRGRARGWHERYGAAVVAIPDTPTDLDSLTATADELYAAGVPFRLDPIVEPIGFGFAASLGRYLETRRRFPDAELLMGVGNLTELTDADSAGVNVMLAGFCQEIGVRSVLTTEVINWCRSAVKEFDLARRLVYHAVREKVLPKKLEPDLILFRDPKLYELGEAGLADLARGITDRNYRLFAERGELHVLNGSMYLRGTDPFDLFAEMQRLDPKLDVGHAFYLGYEMAKAATALTAGKTYTQDQALRWGFLTVPEVSRRGASGTPPPRPPPLKGEGGTNPRRGRSASSGIFSPSPFRGGALPRYNPPMKFDSHMHTRRYSPDSVIDPYDLVRRAQAIGLDGIVITEHDKLWPEAELDDLRRVAPGLVVLGGVEVSGRNGDVLCYGVTDLTNLRRGTPWGALCREVRRQGGVAVAAHPYRWCQDFDELLEEEAPDLAGLEMMSNNMTPDLREKAAAFIARRPGFATLGNSDAHELHVVGCCYTEFDADIRTTADFVAAVLARKGRPMTNDQ